MSELLIQLDLGGEPHAFRFGRGVLDGLGARLAVRRLQAPAAVICDAALAAGPLARTLVGSLDDYGLRPFVVEVNGERDKTLAGAEAVWSRFADEGLERGGVVVALGGGAVGDLAGFCAHGWHRGVALVQVPTTLLAMADSAIGGKAAVNLPRGKNLIGAFHLPLEVVADCAALETLSERDLSSGMAEVVKCALLSDTSALAQLCEASERVFSRDFDAIRSALELAVTTKARLAGPDLRDTLGPRALLNLGHLVAHALETEVGHAELRHGEAVSVGLVAAARLAVTRGLFDDGSLTDLRVTLAAYRLPIEPPAGVDLTSLVARTHSDKKRRGGRSRMVLPLSGGGAALHEVDDGEILAALELLS